MSQATLNDEAVVERTTPSDATRPETEQNQPTTPDVVSQFEYKPVPIYAPVAAVIGVISGGAMQFEFFVLIAFFGIFIGAFAMWRIRQSSGTLGGAVWARIGLFASVICFFGGITTHAYAYATEVPEGHIRVNFSRDISKRQFIDSNGVRELHPAVAPLKDQKIFIKGYMYNTQKQTGLEDFVLLKDNGQCCFGGAPKLYDMMIVKLPPGKTVDKIEGLISVSGTLRCTPHSPHVVYMIEANYGSSVVRARTSH